MSFAHDGFAQGNVEVEQQAPGERAHRRLGRVVANQPGCRRDGIVIDVA
ncbi:hypothetical protein [Massilia sp. H6]|nr:hypothetical protein [Massilia sp. H6]UVW29526.1 hypothetical protein NRS07_05185 [Massilia sp. H6]